MRRLPLRLPPRMRGKGNLLLDGNIPLGITPAYAGKRDLVISGSGDIEDHPRVCGEKWQNRVNQLLVRGSPPRMRGKAVLASTTLYRSGITPAYAGKRDLVISGSGDIEDHPRVCGEKSTSEAQKSSDMGSPPRMRGKELGFHIVAVKIGITPACAGKSS